MGLAGPRKRAKFSHDPNNTAWSRSTTGFGHTILRSQGWNPGETLGAKDAPHAHLHSAASSSHIRVAFREDNLGLGAKQGGSLTEGQCTGLDVFQSLLGRLNGKSEEVLKKEQSSRDDLKRMQYTESRWGTMRFVNGGVLLGKQIESIIKPEDGISESKIKLEPKIKVEDENQETTVVTARIEKTRVKEESTENEGVVLEVNGKKGKKKTKDKKRKRSEEKKSAKASGTSEPQTLGTAEHTQRIPEGGDEGKRAKKEEKLRRRAERAKRKLEHKERKLAKSSKSTNEQDTSDLVPTNPAKVLIEETISRSIPIPLKASSGRHAVRQRYIQHKKMAMMDPKALNEIFMIKAK